MRYRDALQGQSDTTFGKATTRPRYIMIAANQLLTR
jgi:hypothetical protein